MANQLKNEGLINVNSNSSGVYVCKIIYKKGQEMSRVYIPGIHVNPVNSDNTLNETIYNENENSYLLCLWESKAMRDAIPEDKVLSGWIQYCTGDQCFGVIMGYMGQTLIEANSWSGGAYAQGTGPYSSGAINSVSSRRGKILIIPGHDKVNNVSTSSDGSIYESDLTRMLASALHSELEKLRAGCSIIYSLDDNISFYSDVKAGKLKDYDVSQFATAIELHFNNAPAAFCLVRNERINDNLVIEKAISNAIVSIGFKRVGDPVRQVSGNTNYDTLGNIEFFHQKQLDLIYVEVANMDDVNEMNLFQTNLTQLAAAIAKVLYDNFGNVIVNGRGNSKINYSDWIYPLTFRAYPGSSGHFGDSRSGGRVHAGIDLFTKGNGVDIDNCPVYACQSGVVIEISDDFYEPGVGSIAVQHADGSVIRYGEVNAISGISLNTSVQKGQQIGIVPTNSAGNAMIHFETYVGGVTGSLSQTNASNYDYVPIANYKRRSDLHDPTFIQEVPIPS